MPKNGTRSNGGVNKLQRVLYFSNWPLGATCLFGGLELGIVYGYLMHGFSIDGGVATLVGALFGVFGLIWNKQFNKLTREDPLGMFIGEGAAVVWREAHILGRLTAFGESSEPSSFGHILAQQVGRVLDCMAALEKKLPHLQMQSYGAYLELETLSKVMALERVTLENEARELRERPTRKVINIAKKKLTKVAGRVANSCGNVCAVVNFEVELPAESEIGFHVDEIRKRPPKLGVG